MSPIPKCQALHIVRSCLCVYPYKDVKLLWKFFYINICGFINRDKFLYETRVLDNSYLRFKVQFPASDSTEITAGGPKITLEGHVPLDAP